MDMNTAFFKYFIYYPVIYSRREYVPYFLSRLMQSQWYEPDKIQSTQAEKLRHLLEYAKQNVPYYQAHFNLPFSVDEKLNGIETIPFLDKEILRTQSAALASRTRFSGMTKKTTGGSTGKSVTIWKTPHAMGQELAAAWRGYSWAGIKIGEKQGRFWGVPFSLQDRMRARMIDFVTHRRRCSAFSFNEESMVAYTQLLNSFKPKYLYGYVSMLSQYAEFLQKTNRTLSFPIHCVITTSEVLSNYHRKLFENTFSCPVYNEYGCGEVGTIAHECEKGAMHVNSENVILEILDGDRRCKQGELGEIVVTELNNFAMPLIRYRLGDYAAFSDVLCSCGRKLPVIQSIAGRAYDLVYNKKGMLFHGEFFMYIFEEIKRKGLGVAAFQVIQIDYDRLHVKIQPEEGYGEATKELIKRRIHDLYDSDANVEFEIVDGIKREASGKMRLVVGMSRGRS